MSSADWLYLHQNITKDTLTEGVDLSMLCTLGYWLKLGFRFRF